jgi:hypothetical protein
VHWAGALQRPHTERDDTDIHRYLLMVFEVFGDIPRYLPIVPEVSGRKRKEFDSDPDPF